jgi:RNA polymerase sigma-70 factor (ECF subfamily)
LLQKSVFEMLEIVKIPRTAPAPSYHRRDYIKGVLFHLVSQYRRQQKKQLTSLGRTPPPAVNADDEDRQFWQSWRDQLLAITWARLAEAKPDYFTVLHTRATHPDWTSQELTDALAPQLGRELGVAAARQLLHRARKRFADLLLAEVSASLKNPTIDAVQEELRDLELTPYLQFSPEP